LVDGWVTPISPATYQPKEKYRNVVDMYIFKEVSRCKIACHYNRLVKYKTILITYLLIKYLAGVIKELLNQLVIRRKSIKLWVFGS